MPVAVVGPPAGVSTMAAAALARRCRGTLRQGRADVEGRLIAGRYRRHVRFVDLDLHLHLRQIRGDLEEQGDCTEAATV